MMTQCPKTGDPSQCDAGATLSGGTSGGPGGVGGGGGAGGNGANGPSCAIVVAGGATAQLSGACAQVDGGLLNACNGARGDGMEWGCSVAQ
jgi:hypothetical protein